MENDIVGTATADTVMAGIDAVMLGAILLLSAAATIGAAGWDGTARFPIGDLIQCDLALLWQINEVLKI
jgi:hypothetical protein